MAQDYPDGMSRMLPGHTVDLESGFARPWYDGSSVVIAAGASGSYTLNFEDDDGIYYIDVVNVSPSAYKEFTVIIHVNDVPYVCGSVMGFFFFNLRLNPSLLFISGDSVKVEILNLDAAEQTFSVKLQGTKVTRPVGFGKPPGAYYTASPLIGIAPLSVVFADGSTYTPVSWAWKVNGDNVESTEQNPTVVVPLGGQYSPYLKVTNQYGYDTFARADYLSVADQLPLSLFTESDPNGRISGLAYPITVTSVTRDEDAYIARDYGANYFDGYDILIQAKITGGTASSYCVICLLGLNAPALVSGGGVNVVVEFYRPASSTQQIMLRLHKGVTVTATDTYNCSLNTYYYMRLVHVAGSTTFNLYIYSDAAYSTLVDTLTITNAAVATKFRYLHACSSLNDGYSYSASAVISSSGIISVS